MINIVTIGYRYEGLDDLFLNISISVRNAKYFLDNYDMFIDLAMANHVLYYMEANLEYPFTEDNIILPYSYYKNEYMKLVDTNTSVYIVKNKMLGNLPSSIMQKEEYITFLKEHRNEIINKLKQIFLIQGFGDSAYILTDNTVVVFVQGQYLKIGKLQDINDFCGLINLLSRYQKRKNKELYETIGTVWNYKQQFNFI